jgi:hypothetical protein
MKNIIMTCWLIVTFSLAITGIAGEGTAQDTKSKDTPNARIVPFKDGYCSVDGPLFIMAKAGAEFTFLPEVEYKGKKFQIMKPISPNAYGVSSISVQFLTKTKEPSGPPKNLECDSQNWNEKQKTVDFHYRDDTIQVVVHIYAAAMGGFVIKDIECAPPGKAK